MSLPTMITARRSAWAIALVPILLALAVMAGVGEGERTTLSTDDLPRGYDSTQAAALLEELPDESTTAAVVLFTAEEGELDRDQLSGIQRAARTLDAAGGEAMPAKDGTAALAIVQVPAGSATAVADHVKHLRAEADDAAPQGVTAQVTGPAAIEADLAAVFDGANLRLLLATAAVVALLLVITYRSPVLWLIPLAVVGVADRFAAVAATQVMAATGVAWNESTTGILSVLVFGAGTDYALLLISRYRDELRVTESRHEAMATALRRTSHAVLASATTVVLGLLTLLLSVTPTTRGLGLACAVGVVCAAFFALVVLPAALVCFGRWIFWPRVPRSGRPLASDEGTIFHRIGARVARTPGRVIAGTLVVLALLGSGIFAVDLGLDRDDQFLDEPEAITASTRLAESFPAGIADPTQVVTRSAGGKVAAAVREVDGVQSARPGRSGGGISVVETVLAGGDDQQRATIERLRSALEPFPDTHVTGSTAQSVDEHDSAERDLLLIVPLILALVLLGLVLLLRAAVAPVLLVATVVLTYLAAMGAAWWVFTGVLGFDSMDTGVPLFAFLFLVALGVDYNIFLVSRAREESAQAGVREGMLRALSATGGVITSAGILLAAVFAVLGVLPLVVLAQLGTVICIGVLLDTLVVRTVLVPALAIVLGRRFWWPGRLSRRSP